MKLTVTWELDGLSVEKAVQLAEKWAAGRIGSSGRLGRPTSVKVTGSEQPPDDSPGRELADRRRELGLSQRALARHTNLTHSVISDVERGRRGPDSQAAHTMRRALDEFEAAR